MTDGVLRRKVAPARSADGGAETGARAWRVALARAARDCIGLDLDITVLRDDRRSLAELLDLVPDRALLAVLEGPGRCLGLVALSPEVLASVIERQTIGTVTAAAPAARRPTRTDAALSVRLLDTALGTLETLLETAPDLTWMAGFRYASFLDDARPLGLLLDDVPWRVLSCDTDIAGGRRQGRVLLALPAEGRGPKPALAPRNPDKTADPDWTAALSGAVMGAELAFDAVIARLRLPLAQAKALEPGMLLPLPDARIDRVHLLGAAGDAAAIGKLGQTRGMRAIRLRLDGAGAARPDPVAAAAPVPTAGPAIADDSPPLPLARSA